MHKHILLWGRKYVAILCLDVNTFTTTNKWHIIYYICRARKHACMPPLIVIIVMMKICALQPNTHDWEREREKTAHNQHYDVTVQIPCTLYRHIIHTQREQTLWQMPKTNLASKLVLLFVYYGWICVVVCFLFAIPCFCNFYLLISLLVVVFFAAFTSMSSSFCIFFVANFSLLFFNFPNNQWHFSLSLWFREPKCSRFRPPSRQLKWIIFWLLVCKHVFYYKRESFSCFFFGTIYGYMHIHFPPYTCKVPSGVSHQQIFTCMKPRQSSLSRGMKKASRFTQ